MIFLTEADFSTLIKSDNLDAVIRNNPVLLDYIEQSAIAEITSYLNSKYDCPAIFSATGDERNPLILMYACDMILYHLHAAFAPIKIPAIRVERYNVAIAWLKMVAKGDIAPGLPAALNTPASGMSWGQSTIDSYNF